MSATYRNAFLGDDLKDGYYSFDYDGFMELFEFLIDNIYLRCDVYVLKILGFLMELTVFHFSLIVIYFTMSTISYGN